MFEADNFLESLQIAQVMLPAEFSRDIKHRLGGPQKLWPQGKGRGSSRTSLHIEQSMHPLVAFSI